MGNRVTKSPSLMQRVQNAARAFMLSSGTRLVQVARKGGLPYAWPAWRQNEPQWHLIDDQAYIEEGFKQNSLIYSAVMYKVRQGSLAPLRAYVGDVDSPELAPSDHPLQMLCSRPNPHQSWAEFQGVNQVYYNTLGNAYVYLERSGTERLPRALWSLRPDRVYVVPDGRSAIRGYLYIPEGKTRTDAIPLLPQDVMHIKLPNPSDALEGMGEGFSPLASAARSIDVDNAVTRFIDLFFANGAIPQGILKFDVDLDTETVDEIKARWHEMYGGFENWTQIGVLDRGGDYQRAGLTFQEMGFATLDDRNEARILMPFGVPAVLLGTRFGLERSTFSNMEEARRMFWQDTFTPELRSFETEYRYYLQDGTSDAFVAFDFSEVPALQADVPALVNAAKALFDMGVPVNQALDAVGLSEIVGEVEEGDTGFVSSSIIPVKEAAKKENMPPPSFLPAGGSPPRPVRK